MNGTFGSWEQAVLWLRDQPHLVDLVRDAFYDDPLVAACQRYHEGSEWRAVRALLPAPQGRALDLGAGRGIASYALARDGWEVTALEPDPSGIVGAAAIRGMAVECGLPITVTEAWGEKLPFPDGHFTVAHCRQVLHHAKDLPQLCKELARVVRPGGVVVATREHVLSRQADLPAFLDAHPLHKFYGGENAYLLSEYTGALRAAGLDVVSVLNPWQSDINLFPLTRAELKKKIARKLRLPTAALVPGQLLDLFGALQRTPGRLYTFVARRPA